MSFLRNDVPLTPWKVSVTGLVTVFEVLLVWAASRGD
jgi:hypothetical protein